MFSLIGYHPGLQNNMPRASNANQDGTMFPRLAIVLSRDASPLIWHGYSAAADTGAGILDGKLYDRLLRLLSVTVSDRQ